MTAIRVLGIAGSLREGSYNRALLRAAAGLVPAGMTLETASLDLPLYNGDVEQRGMPPAVAALRERIARADALLIATPEYNKSISGVLKNAIDWASRKPEPPLDGKPAAILGASAGRIGTALAQSHLRQIGAAVNLRILNRPEVYVATAQEKFDAAGELTDERTRDAVRELLLALSAWTSRLTGRPEDPDDRK